MEYMLSGLPTILREVVQSCIAGTAWQNDSYQWRSSSICRIPRGQYLRYVLTPLKCLRPFCCAPFWIATKSFWFMQMRMLESNPQNLLTLDSDIKGPYPQVDGSPCEGFRFRHHSGAGFVESIHTLLLNNYLGCGVGKSDTDEHGTNSIYSCHVGFGVQMKVLKVLIQSEFWYGCWIKIQTTRRVCK